MGVGGAAGTGHGRHQLVQVETGNLAENVIQPLVQAGPEHIRQAHPLLIQVDDRRSFSSRVVVRYPFFRSDSTMRQMEETDKCRLVA